MKNRAYIVRRTDNWSGLSIRARSEAEAIKKAKRWAFMRGAAEYQARLFFGEPMKEQLLALLLKYGVRGVADALAEVIEDQASKDNELPYDTLKWPGYPKVWPDDLRTLAMNLKEQLW